MSGRKTADEGANTRTWWDRPDEPPRIVTDAAGLVLRHARRIVPASGTVESRRGALIRFSVLAVILFVLAWLVLAGVLAQA